MYHLSSKVSDEEFFGVWDKNYDKWEVKGKINYEYHESLLSVKKFVEEKNYCNAKKELLEYYRKNAPEYKTSELPENMVLAKLWAEQIILFDQQEKYITTFSIGNKYKVIEIDVTEPFRHKRWISFILMGYEKEQSIAYFHSKENEHGGPILEIETSEFTKKYKSIADTYIRAGKYSNINYGKEKNILVRDSGHLSGQITDEDTMKALFKFDLTDLNSDEKILKAKIHLCGRTDSKDGNKIIMLLESLNEYWSESDLTWDTMIHSSYSWKGIEGGYNWSQPKGASSQYSQWNTRFYWFQPMIKEYLKTGNEIYACNAISLLLSFINNVGHGSNYLAASTRIGFISQAYRYVIKSKPLTADINAEILKYLWQETDFLCRTEHYRPADNAGMAVIYGVYSSCSYYPQFNDRDKWKNRVESYLKTMLAMMVRPDGAYVESCMGYPMVVLRNYLNMLDIGKYTGNYLKCDISTAIIIMTRYMRDMSYPNGIPSAWGEGEPRDTKPLALEVGARFNCPDLVYWGTDGKQGDKPAYTSVHYSDARVCMMRTSWDKSAATLFANARNGGFHNHKDSLHMTLYAYEQELLTDSGMTNYDSRNPHFQWQRHRSISHNTIEINRKTQNAWNEDEMFHKYDSFSEFTTNNAFDAFEGWTDANDGFRYYRNIFFVKSCMLFIVSDYIISFSGGEVANHYAQAWHTGADSNIIMDEKTKQVRSNFPTASNILIVPSESDEIIAETKNGYYAKTNKNPLYVEYSKNVKGNARFNTILYPYKGGEMPEIYLRSIEKERIDNSSVILFNLQNSDININGFYYYYHNTSNLITYNKDGTMFNGKMCYYQKNKNGILTFAFIRLGNLLKVDGIEVLRLRFKIRDIAVTWEEDCLNVCCMHIHEILHVGLEIYCPQEIKKMVINKTEYPFLRVNDYILIGY